MNPHQGANASTPSGASPAGTKVPALSVLLRAHRVVMSASQKTTGPMSSPAADLAGRPNTGLAVRLTSTLACRHRNLVLSPA